MSLSVTKIVNLQAALKFSVPEVTQDAPKQDFKTIGGVFSDDDHAWLASGPRLQIINTKTGSKVGEWSFGSVLRDSDTNIVCVDEIQRPHGQLPFLAVGIDCDFSEGMICIFDCVTSKIIRAIHISDKISTLHVIDAGYDVFTFPGPLRNFDGIIAVGTAGGNVFLVDICRQICDEVLSDVGLNEIRDELNPCLLSNITVRDLEKMEYHKEFAIRNGHHLAIHLNVVFDKTTKHFILKGPKGDDRIHVDKDEVQVSALYYCPQLGSLLVGYNFGALQLYNLMNLELVYTSPVCDEHIPISHFTIQEPADDPKAVCYIWAIYSATEKYPTCLPLAVMYAFCYQSKEYHEGYGCLYQDFSSASVHYQMELGVPFGHKRITKQRGGSCLKIKSINHISTNTEGSHHDSNEDNLTLCAFVWNVWFSNKVTDTFLAIFDLNQWYKEQMPSVPNAHHTSSYMLQLYLNDLIDSATNKTAPILDVCTNKKTIEQFSGAQRLEEHFHPNSITLGMTCLRETDVVYLYNYGVQKALLVQIESLGPLCLVEPSEIYQEVASSGLVPIFIELPVNSPVSTNQQREIILSTALENQMNGWLCKCASEWANGSFLAAGCSLDLLISWAFQRAVALKTNGDKFCVSLFDYSEVRLDNNTTTLLGSCTRQLKILHSLYIFIIKRLLNYVSNQELVLEQYKSLETVSIYFEVLQWLLNVGLLPECPLSAYPRSDEMERISAPYPGEMLAEFYNHRRALLKILNEENLSKTESILYIDALIEKECGGRMLQEQWRKDGGNGLYPPPSLQALLRTYLNENVDLSYKHSVIIYVFLDLAMTLDQDRYKPVITQLIKFPAVFKVKPSVIKITQAFWQLDHADFNTAMGLLLDPLIISEDLSQWHHQVALRALILQKQHNFALLYIKARRPILKDDEDILTAISLYVANDMVDEAFYFKNSITQDQEKKFLTHLLNECKRNKRLKLLVHRTLNSDEENNFLKYLSDNNVSNADDLHVFYHLLRSRFIETFEIHENTVSRPLEKQGLFGQENATPRDKLVDTLKKILPEINSTLINVCHNQKLNTWHKEVRPTPMSVFVRNMPENVHYKSTLIGAALAKAKQTFNESSNRSFKVETETTPFLRTPTVTPRPKRSSCVFVNSKIINNLEDHHYTSPPSAKRLKLSPRVNTSAVVHIPSKLSTPLVKRKTPKTRDTNEKPRVTTPHSILKVKSFMDKISSSRDVEFEDDFREFEKIEYTPVSSLPKKSGLGLSPRKSLTRAPVVRFEGLTSGSSSSLDNTRSSLGKLPDSGSVNVSSGKLSISPKGNLDTSKNTSTDEETFYSPETSLEDKNEKDITDKTRIGTTQVVGEVEKKVLTKIEEKVEPVEDHSKSSPVFSPKSRKSYKRSLGQSTPVRSSPRLSRNSSLNTESSSSSKQNTTVSSKTTLNDSIKTSDSISEERGESVSESPKSPSLLPKLRPRKSLCRIVLESNAMNNVLTSPVQSPRGRRSRKIESPTVTKVKETIEEKVVLELRTKFEDGEERLSSSFTRREDLTTSFVESPADTSEDFSIDYGNPEKLKLSDSMMECINTPYKTISTNDVLEGSRATEVEGKDHSTVREDIDERSGVQEFEQEQALSQTKDIDKSIEETTTNEPVQDQIISVSSSPDNNQIEPITIDDSPTKKTFDADSVSITYSVLDSSAEIFNISDESITSKPKLSESMLRCINNREGEDFENIQEEAMEVDDIVMTEEVRADDEKDKSDEMVYTNLSPAVLNETEKEEAHLEFVAEESSSNKEKETSDGEPSNIPIDPEMNNFEIYDDLNFIDGLTIEKEVTLGENDLCYGQQNTLEAVLEENIAVSSTSLSVLEKNVFNESYVSDEESSKETEEDECQADARLETEDVHKSDKSNAENEVIEIGSSSEEDNTRDSYPGSHYSSDFEKHAGETYGARNIFDSDDDDESSESVYQHHHSEISENSDDSFDKTKEYGLFQGDVVFFDEEKNNANNDVEEKSQDHISENVENEENVCTEQRSYDCEVKEAVKAIMDQQEESRPTEDVKSSKEDDHEKKQEVDEPNESPIANVSNKKEVESDVSVEMDELTYSVENISAEKETEVEINTQVATDDVSMEMGELNYSVTEEESNKEQEEESNKKHEEESNKEQQEESNKEQEAEAQEINNFELQENTKENSEKSQCDISRSSSSVNENLEEVADTEVKTAEESIHESVPCQDPLDVDDSAGFVLLEKAEPDIIEQIIDSFNASVSNSISAKHSPDTEAADKIEMPQRLTKRATDILEQLEMKTPTVERDLLADLVQTTQAVRVLRSRRISTENTPSPVVTRRKRSASVDDVKVGEKQSTKKKIDLKDEDVLKRDTKSVEEDMKNKLDEAVEEVPKSRRRRSISREPVEKESEADQNVLTPRSRRAKSVVNLPKIPEENVTPKKSRSVLEGYSMHRRVTRQQATMLKNMDLSSGDLTAIDPIVLLDKIPFDGKPDPEEAKVYEVSPSTTNSTSGSPTKKPARRLRSASQTSETSRRSKSRTPVRNVRKKSTEESQPVKSEKTVEDVNESEESLKSVEPRTTRSRARSVSSVQSDDSNSSEKAKPAKRKQRTASQNVLPNIQEEEGDNESKPVIPKKRTRKNSSKV